MQHRFGTQQLVFAAALAAALVGLSLLAPSAPPTPRVEGYLSQGSHLDTVIPSLRGGVTFEP